MATKTPPPFHTRAARWIKSPSGQRFTHMSPALVVFGVAAWQSYWHAVEVVDRAGEGQHGVAHMMALSVDGLMIVASRYITHAPTKLGKVIAALSFLAGVVATFAVNILAADPNAFSRAVAVWPAVALVGTAAILHWGERKPAKRPVKPRTRATGTPATKPTLKLAASN